MQAIRRETNCKPKEARLPCPVGIRGRAVFSTAAREARRQEK